MKRLLALALLVALPAHAQTSDPNYIYAQANVINATNTAGAWDALVYVWNNPDDVDAPETAALVSACENVYDDLSIVLIGRGWTVLPPDPNAAAWVPMLTNRVCWRINPNRQGFWYAASLQIAVGPDGIYSTNKSGTMGRLDTSVPGGKNPATAPVIDWIQGTLVDIPGLARHQPNAGGAGTLGGIWWSGTEWWGNLSNWYNTSGQRDPNLVAFAPDQSWAAGMWHAGNQSAAWTCQEIPGLNCAKWVDPLTLSKFHQNKTGEWITGIPASWAARYLSGYSAAVGRQRPAGAFGGAQGPALYAIRANATDPTNGDQGAVPLLVYPTGSRTGPPYWNAVGDDTGTDAVWIEQDGRQAVLFAWATPRAGQNKYLNQGPPCNQEKGWHALGVGGVGWAEWMAAVYVYDPAELGQVALGQLDPWQPQPVAVLDMGPDLWMPADPTCEGPFVTGVAYDAASRQLWAIQPEAGGDKQAALVYRWDVK